MWVGANTAYYLKKFDFIFRRLNLGVAAEACGLAPGPAGRPSPRAPRRERRPSGGRQKLGEGTQLTRLVHS